MSSLFEKYLRTLHFWSSVLSVILYCLFVSKQKAGYHRHDDTLPLLVYILVLSQQKIPRSNESGGIFLGRHSYALGTLTESDGWRLYGLRLLIFPQPLGRALKNQNAAPASAPCFRRRRRSPPLLFSSCTVHPKTAAIPVDIPMRWEPRTNQSPTGALIAFAALGTCCSSPVPSCSDVG